EAGCLTLDGAFRVQAAGVDVRLIAVLDTSDGADAVVSAPGAKLARPADLRGKRVAVERYGVGMLFFCRALQSAGLTVRDVHVVNADLPQFERLFSTGRVDAAVTYSPQKERLVAAGGRVLCDSAAFPSKVTDVLVVRADAIRNNPHAARALARGWAQAADRLAADPSRRGAVARAMGIALSEVDTGYEQLRVPTSAESRALVAQERPEFLTTVRETAEALAAFGLIDERVDPARLFLTPAEMDTLR
ncbi:MAG: ABC transporter substrate-binding protein, partial [Gemmata sp.]